MKRFQDELIASLYRAGWELEVLDEAERWWVEDIWWIDEVWRLRSLWSPQSAQLYLMFVELSWDYGLPSILASASLRTQRTRTERFEGEIEFEIPSVGIPIGRTWKDVQDEVSAFVASLEVYRR